MMIKKLITFEDLGFVQWGVLDAEETGVYSAIALEEAFFTPHPETLAEFVQQGNEGLLALADALEQNEKDPGCKSQTTGYNTHPGTFAAPYEKYLLCRRKLCRTHRRIPQEKAQFPAKISSVFH